MQEQDSEKEEGEFETFLTYLLLSLADVYATGNELQCDQAADWLESDGCLCWPEISPCHWPTLNYRLHLIVPAHATDIYTKMIVNL